MAIVGGNWNNSTLLGASCVNLNNAASNTNTYIGACHSYYSFTDNAPYDQYRLVEIKPIKEGLSTERERLLGNKKDYEDL